MGIENWIYQNPKPQSSLITFIDAGIFSENSGFQKHSGDGVY